MTKSSSALITTAFAVFVTFVENVHDTQGQGISLIAGFRPESDVSEHAKIDLDQRELENLFDAFKFEEAMNIYENGKNSKKSTGLRTIKGFSTDTLDNGLPKLKGEPMFDMYAAYWGSPTYADDFVQHAAQGVGQFEGATKIARSECANKGAQYQNIWMYVIHELEDAIKDCKSSNLNNNDMGVRAWDEGWAFYAGSLEGPDGSGSGFLGHALAEKRCANFGTCTADEDGEPFKGKAQANAKLLGYFAAGQALLSSGACAEADELLRKSIIPQLTVPLVQGALRYAYLADPQAGGHGNDKTTLSKPWAEGWIFTAAVLPQVDACDASVAQQIRNNMQINAVSPMKDGYKKVVSLFESVYSCMGIKCSDIGGYKLKPTGDFVIPPCVDQTNLRTSATNDENNEPRQGLSGGAIIGIVVGVLFGVVLVALISSRLTRKRYVHEIEKMEDTFQQQQNQQQEQANKPASSVARA